jgi:uncharacterized RDD family membrane protein YckC
VCKRCWGKYINRRQCAGAIDYIVLRMLIVSVGLAGITWSATSPVIANQGGQGYYFRIDFVTLFLSMLLLTPKDAFAGRSPGKWLLGLRVVDRDTAKPISLLQSIERNLPLVIPFAPLIAAIQINKGPRLGDGWANTKVIWTKYANNLVFDESAATMQPEFAPVQAGPMLGSNDPNDPYRAPRI